MPLMILYGGELVFLFLGVRVARWMWRSRENVLALWRARHGGAPPSPAPSPDPCRAPAPVARAVVKAIAPPRTSTAAPAREAA